MAEPSSLGTWAAFAYWSSLGRQPRSKTVKDNSELTVVVVVVVVARVEMTTAVKATKSD